MAVKQVFVQIVDKKSGQIEEVVNLKTLEAMDIDKKVALTKGKELYIVTHKIDPVIKIEMKQKKIIEPISYISHDENLTIQIDEAPEVSPEKKEEDLAKKVVKKTSKKTEKPAVEAELVKEKKKTVKKTVDPEEVVEKKKAPRKKKKTDL